MYGFILSTLHRPTELGVKSFFTYLDKLIKNLEMVCTYNIYLDPTIEVILNLFMNLFWVVNSCKEMMLY